MSTPTAEQPETTPVADLSYEQAREELVRIVGSLEGGNVTLEQSLALWERGEALAAHCEAALDSARRRLDGEGTSTPDAPDTTDADASDEQAQPAESRPTKRSSSA